MEKLGSLLGLHKEYKFAGICNFRDLHESSNGIIPAGKIFRSATPSEATPEDAQHLIDKLGIKTILDLRTTAESSLDIGDNILRREFTVIPETALFKTVEIERYGCSKSHQSCIKKLYQKLNQVACLLLFCLAAEPQSVVFVKSSDIF
jgi:hypothetical protein